MGILNFKLKFMTVDHPLQSTAWAKFQKKQGHLVFKFKNYYLILHHLPHLPYKIGTILRGPDITQEMLNEIKPICHQEKVIFVKIEPNVLADETSFYHFKDLVSSSRVNFYPYSFFLDLTLTDEELLKRMHPKTRYNIKVAARHGVKVREATDKNGFEIYLKLLTDTARRQGFFIHNETYHRNLWSSLKNSNIPHIFLAEFQGQVLAAFMIFKFKDKIYYPYGASSGINRQVMAPNLLMWEVIKWGKSQGCKVFDMWGALPTEAKEGDYGYGFHRFKSGFGGKLVKFVGSYDYVISPSLYKVFITFDNLRWQLLRLKAKINL